MDRLLWLLSSTVALVSTKYILVDLNYHYPIFLTLLQLTAALAVWPFAVRYPLIRDLNWPTSFWNSSLRTTLSPAHGVAALALGSSLPLYAQAALHFQNLPTLAMLSVIACFVELSMSHVFSSCSATAFAHMRIVLLLMFCILILIDEYRLDVNGLLFAIPALLLAGLSKALCHTTPMITHREGQANSTALFRLLALSTASLMCLAWSIFGESASSAVESLRLDLLPILFVNITASATVLITGCSHILHYGPQKVLNPSDTPTSRAPFEESIVLGSRASFVALLSVVALRRSSFSTSFQLLSFLGALVCIDGSCTPRFQSHDLAPDDIVYDALPTTALPKDSLDSPRDIPPMDSGMVHRKRVSLPRTNILAVSGLSALLMFSILNFDPKPSVEQIPSLDLSFHSPADMDIVISMYKEPLDSVIDMIARLKKIPTISDHARVHIYIKDPAADIEQLRASTQAFNVTKLPNIGREGATYLHHITQNWDTLAKHTMFIQGDVHNPREFYPRIADYFHPGYTGMLSLGFSGQVCNGQFCGDRWGWKDTSSLIPKLYREVYKENAADVLLSYKGQFITSARRIRGVRKAVYEGLLDAFVNPSSWAHQEEYLKGRKDSLDTPIFGYDAERIWSTLLQCSDLEVAWKCPTLLSGKRRGGDIGDCQCFDFRGGN